MLAGLLDYIRSHKVLESQLGIYRMNFKIRDDSELLERS